MIKFKIRLLIAFAICIGCSAAVLSSAQLPVEARGGASEEDDDPVISTSYVLPNQIFNDGKPYYAAKDPISGQLDFNVKKPAGIETSANEVVDPNEKTVISSSSPNIHDFLNLPVKYSSSKFVYPLVSSSYANLKYQGSNKNYITNKKPTQVIQATSAPNYHTANYFTLPTTKLTPVSPTQPSTTSSSSTTTTTTTSTTSTTKKPTTTSTSTTSTTSTSTSTSTTSTTSTTKAPVPTQTSTLASSSAKYTTSSKRPTTTTTPAPKTSTTRKKFVPTKKYSTSTTGTTSTTMHLSEQQQQQKFDATKPTKPTTTAGLTTRHPTPSAAIFPTDATESKDWYPAPPSTSTTGQPVVFTEDPTSPPAFSPLPTSTRIPDLDPADVYHTLDQKNVENKFEQKPSMTLADIFNSLAEEESAVAAISNPSHQGLDAQGNLMEPLDPSKPSPFAMQQNSGRRPQAPPTKPTFGTTSNAPALNGQVISSNQENFNNEYVSYQVQQPNIMQYRPAPGAINNVVISPGQNSASFVLGSQQQVGANQFGSVEKEPLFSKEHQHPVQYGTVINEDISTLNRQPPPSPPTPYQEMPKPVPTSNFHQNGNYATDSIRPDIPRPPSGANGYQEPPPAAPSPYQQLPLIGSNVRNKISGQKPQPPQQPQQQQSVALSGAGIGSVQSVDPQENADPNSVTLGSSQNTKELLVSTNIRFPANEEQSAEVPSLPVASGPPAGPQINGHAQPLSLQQIQNTNTVVFPKSEETVGGTVSDAAAGAAVQIQKHEVLTMSQHQQKLNFPTSNEPNTPATHMVPPPRFPPPLPNSINEHDLQKPSRPHGGPQYPFNEYTRKPIPGITRPNPDRHLPNILPQFRPSSKVSTGHPQQTNFNQEPGNILVGGLQQPPPHLKRGPNVGNPQFSHRRQPLGQQSRYPLNRNIDYPSVGPPPPQLAPHEIANRRIYRVSPYGGQGMQYLERPGGGYPRRPHMPHGLRPAESLNVERHVMSPVLEKLPAFEEEDLVINDPPQPIAPSKESSLVNDSKLEPVVTLQMLQSQKKAVSLPNDDTGAGEIQVPSLDEAEEEINQAAESNNRNGLYVVYPMAGDKNSEVAAEDLKNKLPAVAHVEPPTGSEYQNTPFSVVRDEPQEPILKNKKPVSLQQQQKAAANKDAFPYPIEKPDPSYSELNKPSKVPGVLIAPKIINGAYGTGTIAPIAIAYTPTEPTPHIKKMQQEQHQYQMQQQQQYQQQMQQQQKHQEQQMYSNVNLATPVIKEIRQFDQAQDNGHDIDLRGQNYEKNFMAPFYPSVSLDSVTSTPSNGWNILKTTKEPLYSKNNIDRSDVNSANKDGQTEAEEEATENTTLKSFEMDKFQPELQGGFKPIYPPGYKLANEDEEQEQLEKHESNNMPLALASHMEMPLHLQQAAASSTSSSTSSTTSTTTTAKPLLEDNKEVPNTTKAPPQTETTTKRIKSKFETSLAALLFGEDDTDAEMEAADGPREEPQARKEPTKAMMSGPRSIPRMGPRSLKI